MRVLERNSELVTVFIETNKNFICNFLHKRAAKNCENHQRSLIDFDEFQKHIHLMTQFILAQKNILS
jgi:hypothetical protein